MQFSEEYLRETMRRQTESLDVEFKRWIKPENPDGIAKIVKACIAMKNNNGGVLFIGFDQESRKPDFDNAPPCEDVRKIFNPDDMQYHVSKYAFPLFEIEVRFVKLDEKDDIEYPAICVSDGVEIPVASKSELRCPSTGKILIKPNVVFVRTLSSNGTPSSSEAIYNDWDKIVRICFDNREADIGRFVRRHLANLSSEQFMSVLNTMAEKALPNVRSYEEIASELLDKGNARFLISLKERYPEPQPNYGYWEVACVINTDIKTHTANETFINSIFASNPDLTGWPIWIDSRSFSTKLARPYVYENAWEACIVSNNDFFNHIDFWRIEPIGRFYNLRVLEDDLKSKMEPLKVLDFGMPIWRVGEALVVGLAYAKTMGCDIETTNLTFKFRWSKLKGRVLTSWADQSRHISKRGTAQDEVVSIVNIPLNTPLSAIYQYVDMATKPLYQIFDGFELNLPIIQELTERMLGREG